MIEGFTVTLPSCLGKGNLQYRKGLLGLHERVEMRGEASSNIELSQAGAQWGVRGSLWLADRCPLWAMLLVRVITKLVSSCFSERVNCILGIIGEAGHGSLCQPVVAAAGKESSMGEGEVMEVKAIGSQLCMRGGDPRESLPVAQLASAHAVLPQCLEAEQCPLTDCGHRSVVGLPGSASYQYKEPLFLSPNHTWASTLEF